MAQNSPVLVAAFYRFAPLQNLQELRAELQQLGGDQGVLGTVLLAAEGVNGTVCGTAEAVSALLDRLRICLLYTSPSPRDATLSRMPSSA